MKPRLSFFFSQKDTVAAARETYRNDVGFYFSGNTTTISAKDAIEMITNWYDQERREMGVRG